MDYVSIVCLIGDCNLCIHRKIFSDQKAGQLDPQFMKMIKDHILSGNVAAAKALAKTPTIQWRI